MKPLVSVIIPTRNRTKYLLDVVGVILAQAPEAEIVISDNSDGEDLKARLQETGILDKVVYGYTSEHLSVVGNFERALEMSSGEYLIFVGDDDSIGPGLLEVAAWAKAEGVEAVISYADAFIASYFWPGVKSKYYGDAYQAKMFIHRCNGRIRRVDARASTQAVASKFGGGLGRMPRAYHGLVSRALLDRIRARHGAVFGGVSPDIYSATLIAAEVRSWYIVDYPFVIPGASPVSTAGQGAARSDRGVMRETDHISRFGEGLVWDERIPEFYSPYTVWAYSMLQAVKRVPEFGIKPSFPRLYARCLLHCRGHFGTTWQAYRTWARNLPFPMGGLRLLGAVAAELGETAWWILRRIPQPRAGGAAESIGNLHRIGDAYAALVQHLASKGVALTLEPSGTQASPDRVPAP